jgi:hypothetical protein
MRFSTRAVSLLCAAAILLPIGAGAATKAKTIRLRDVVKIVQSNQRPLSFEGTVTTTQGKNKGTVKIAGVQNGTMDSLEDAAVQLTMDVDATFEGEKVGASMEVRVVDAMLYARLTDVSATGDLAELAAAIEPYENTWIEMPLDAEDFEETTGSKPPSLAKFEQYFSIVKTNKNGVNSYAVTIPKEKQRRFLTAVMGVAEGYDSSYRAILRRSVRSTTIDFSLTVDERAGLFQALASKIGVKTSMDGQKGTFAFTGKTSALATAPSIQAPADSVTLEELFDTGGGWEE